MFVQIINAISKYSIPLIIAGFVLYGLVKKVDVYATFTDGAKEGFTTAVNIIPSLVGMLVAIGIFRASGAMELLTGFLGAATSKIGIPGEIVPMALIRPLSGGGARGVMTELVTTHGPNSLIGRMAAIMMGSTDTTFYILAVYFGSVSIRKQRHAVSAGLLADLAGVIAAITMTRIFFG